jgi:hypothetical protein
MCFVGRRHFCVQARVLPVGELVLWYGMFAPCGRLLGTTGFVRGIPVKSPTGGCGGRGAQTIKYFFLTSSFFLSSSMVP